MTLAKGSFIACKGLPKQAKQLHDCCEDKEHLVDAQRVAEGDIVHVQFLQRWLTTVGPQFDQWKGLAEACTICWRLQQKGGGRLAYTAHESTVSRGGRCAGALPLLQPLSSCLFQLCCSSG